MSVSVRGRRRRPDPGSVRRLRTAESNRLRPRPYSTALGSGSGSLWSSEDRTHLDSSVSPLPLVSNFPATASGTLRDRPKSFSGTAYYLRLVWTSREPLSHKQAVAMSATYSFRRIPQILSRSAVGLQPVEEEAKVSSTRGRFLPNADRSVKSCESRNPVSEFYGLWAVEQPEAREYGRRTLD